MHADVQSVSTVGCGGRGDRRWGTTEWGCHLDEKESPRKSKRCGVNGGI
jgi:hypothetical protein